MQKDEKEMEELNHEVLPTIANLERYMEENNLSAVILPETDLFHDHGLKMKIMDQIPLHAFFPPSARKRLKELRSRTHADANPQTSSTRKIQRDVRALLELRENGDFLTLFSKLDARFRKLVIASGIRIPKSLLPPDILVPMGLERIKGIHTRLEQCRDNVELFCTFLKEILKVWVAYEQLRNKSPDPEWMARATAEHEHGEETLAELYKLILYYQTVRGGMKVSRPPETYFARAEQLTLDRLWDRLRKDTVRENIDFLLPILEQVVEYRS